ncbi:hypothetical protein BJY52DRAFT_1193595 [Lactarius psammicola]|nr:hypothetical protein BJY52DRAFT_1193595 [Lactarius psammicola]
MEPSTFPNPVPAGTRIPQWALLDITVRSPLAPSQKSNLTGIPFPQRANFWSASTAQLVGNTPEIFPGEQINILASLSVWPSTPGASSPIVVPAPAPPVFTLPEFTPRRINRRQITPPFPPALPDPLDPLDNWPPGFPPTSSGSGLDTGAIMGSVVRAVTTIAAIAGLVLSLFS